jgi:hypothetical protein
MTNQTDVLVDQALMLITRLERLSADSTWARRASGCRGTLLKLLDEGGFLSFKQGSSGYIDLVELTNLMAAGFQLLEKAAREIPDVQKV